MTSASMAIRMLRREWRAGDLRIVIVALVVATTCMVSVASFTDRLHQAIQKQGSELLAADLVVRSSTPIPDNWLERAHQEEIQTAKTLAFRSVVISAERTRLSEIKAISENYPLRGALRTSVDRLKNGVKTRAIPDRGTVWVEAALLSALNSNIGGHIQLGNAKLKITRVLTYEPDRGGSLFSIGPRVLMNQLDVSSTKLIQPGSVVRHRLLMAGEPSRIKEMRSWVEQNLKTGMRIRDLENANPRFKTALRRAERFLGLAGLVSVLLAGVAIAKGAQHYANRHLDHVAILKCLGSVQSTILKIYFTQLLFLGLGSSLVGGLLGYGGQYVLATLLPDLMNGVLPQPSLMPLMFGVSVGALTLLGFGLPSILRLRDISPLRVLRRDIGSVPMRILPFIGGAFFLLSGLIFWLANDFKLGLYVIGGGLATLLLLAVSCQLVLKLLGLLRERPGVTWRFGISNLVRSSASVTSQTMAVGVGIMAMLLLTLVKNNLFTTWQQSLPPKTPNHFLVNIHTSQIPELTSYFRSQQLSAPNFRPMVRARLMQINNHPIKPSDYQDGFARRQLQRAANMTWSRELSEGNRIVAGQWWRADQPTRHEVSVELRYAQALGIKLGDRLKYLIADQSIELSVSSLRKVSWDSFKPNFFLITPPGLLEHFPATYITSLYEPTSNAGFIDKLVRRYPNVTDINVDAILSQVRLVIDRINYALEFLFMFTIVAGLVVLYAAIYTTRRDRIQQLAVLRTLGATRRKLTVALLAEFISLGLIAGLMGSIAATAVGYLVAETLLGLSFQLDGLLWVGGIGAGITVVTLAGVATTRSLLNSPPWKTLRNQ